MWNYIKVGAIALIIGIIIGLLFSQCNGIKKYSEQPYWEKPNFKTDSVYVPLPYPVYFDTGSVKVIPPKVLTIYRDTSILYRDYALVDSLNSVLDSLLIYMYSEEIKPSLDKKIVKGFFAYDSLSLDYLSIQTGEIISEKYETNYLRFDYIYENGNLSAIEKKYTFQKEEKPSKLWHHGIYANAGYELIARNPEVGVSYDFYIWKVKINAETGIIPKKDFNGYARVRVGFKLNK